MNVESEILNFISSNLYVYFLYILQSFYCLKI